ncbi:hypothetical protein MTP06_34310 [Streptomyces sp. PLM4]|uniref:Uncharacterized protein n=1 Tax=Streptomyces albidoflavus TaxID=1886 RepID=A0AA37BXK8_9ACTN|nr:hypothetical protein MTP06_34310 [Streptomyces sp. PLM4]GHI46717.1 hypothetical protein ScoT_28910 [Streptomyces albidoflavus]
MAGYASAARGRAGGAYGSEPYRLSLDAPTGGRINGAHGRAGRGGRTPLRPLTPPHVTGGTAGAPGADVTGGTTGGAGRQEGRDAPRHPAPPVVRDLCRA